MKQLFKVTVLVGEGEDLEAIEIYVETDDGIQAAVSIAERFVRQENLLTQAIEVVDALRVSDAPAVRLEDVASGH